MSNVNFTLEKYSSLFIIVTGNVQNQRKSVCTVCFLVLCMYRPEPE